MQKLTTHFSLEELTQSSTAQRLGIDNTPPADILPHLQSLAEGLEAVRSHLRLYSVPIHVDSGYRCPTLNTAVHGASDSAHMTGYAADFTCDMVGTPLEITQTLLKTDIQFDELICEGTWVHISFAPPLRRRVMTAHFGTGGTTYTEGVSV